VVAHCALVTSETEINQNQGVKQLPKVNQIPNFDFSVFYILHTCTEEDKARVPISEVVFLTSVAISLVLHIT
jgi:hypothetical protein